MPTSEVELVSTLFEAKSSVIEALTSEKPVQSLQNILQSIDIRLLSSVMPHQTAEFVPVSEEKVPQTVDFVPMSKLFHSLRSIKDSPRF